MSTKTEAGNERLSPSQVFEIVQQEIAGELCMPISDIELDSNLVKLGADSLHKVCIVQRLEEEFGIQITDDDAALLFTVKDIMAYVEEH